jgi:hypothetical protein
MKRLLTIALCALALSGCIAEWKNPHGPQRWSGEPYISPMNNPGIAGESAPNPPPPPSQQHFGAQP